MKALKVVKDHWLNHRRVTSGKIIRDNKSKVGEVQNGLRFVGVLFGHASPWHRLAATPASLLCSENCMTNGRACQPTSVIRSQRDLAP